MKFRGMNLFFILILLIGILTSCSNYISIGNDTNTLEDENALNIEDLALETKKSTGYIHIYGEEHGIKKILDKEIELWDDYYINQGMRHLFIEYPYYTAEFLNIWMVSDADFIFEGVYNDWEGTASHNPDIKEFFMTIKSKYPETIFHGTDVGHQYSTTGQRYLFFLKEIGLRYTVQYALAEDNIEQGVRYYKNKDMVYRENMMTENFMREFDQLIDENVMGIYGAAHTGLESLDFSKEVPCMANQLAQYYPDQIDSEDLSWLIKDIESERVDTFEINGKTYQASYYGKADMSWHKDYLYREFWRLENAYDDFKDIKKTGDVLPYNNYPMIIENKEIYVIDYTKNDKSVERMYYRSDGKEWKDQLVTEAIAIKQN